MATDLIVVVVFVLVAVLVVAAAAAAVASVHHHHILHRPGIFPPAAGSDHMIAGTTTGLKV